MKVKNIVIAQIVLLLAASTAGLILKGDLADGPRLAHRAFGSLATIVGIVSAIMLLKRSSATKQKAAACAAVVCSGLAGFAGMGLKTASNYDMMFNLMRGSATVALVLAIYVLAVEHKTKATK